MFENYRTFPPGVKHVLSRPKFHNKTKSIVEEGSLHRALLLFDMLVGGIRTSPDHVRLRGRLEYGHRGR